MIELKYQIISIFISLILGFMFSFLYNKFNDYLYKTKNIYKVVINMLFSIDYFLIYFIMLKKFSYGYVHFYFILIFLISFLISIKKI